MWGEDRVSAPAGLSGYQLFLGFWGSPFLVFGLLARARLTFCIFRLKKYNSHRAWGAFGPHQMSARSICSLKIMFSLQFCEGEMHPMLGESLIFDLFLQN